MKKSSKFVLLSIILFGFVLLVVGSKVPSIIILGVDISLFLSNLGLYIAVVVALQWIFDEKTKRELTFEVASLVQKSINVIKSGIDDYVENTKKIEYESILKNHEDVKIGFLYSSRFIDDHSHILQERARSGKKTTVIMLDLASPAMGYLHSTLTETGHVEPGQKKIIERIKRINEDQGVKSKINVKYHKAVLRYSFVISEEGIWVKFYRNSTGEAVVPGLYVKKGSSLYGYFQADVVGLEEEATDV